MKQIIIATLLSGLIWPGAGQLYNKDFRKGFVMIGLTILLVLSFMISVAPRLEDKMGEKSQKIDMAAARKISEEVMLDSPGTFRTFNMLMTAVWIFAIVDAYLGAKNRNLKPPPKKPASGEGLA